MGSETTYTDPVVRDDIQNVLDSCRNELAVLHGESLLITGATGFVGSYLVESIVSFNSNSAERRPCSLYLTTRSIASAREKWPHFFGLPNVTWLAWNDGNFDFPLPRCDYIIHAASPADPARYMTDPSGTMETIVSGTKRVVEFASRSKVVRLLYVSSGAIYGKQPDNTKAIPETFHGVPDTRDPRSCYGEAKRVSELLCHASGMPTVIARLFSFIGPYQDLSGSFAAPDFIRQATHTGEIRIRDGSTLRTYCYASDLTSSLWKLLLEGTAGEAYNVGGCMPAISILELARLIGRVVGDVNMAVEGTMLPEKNSRTHYVPDITKLASLYKPRVPLEHALARTLWSMYFRKQIPAPPANADLSELLRPDNTRFA